MRQTGLSSSNNRASDRARTRQKRTQLKRSQVSKRLLVRAHLNGNAKTLAKIGVQRVTNDPGTEVIIANEYEAVGITRAEPGVHLGKRGGPV